MRRLIRQRAAGTRVLEAPSTLGASRPVIDSAGWVQSRSTTLPVPIHSMPSAAPDSARSRASGYSTSAAGPEWRPSIGDAAVVVVEAGDQAAQGHDRVGHEAAPHAAVHGVGQRADLDVHPHQAAQARGEGGLADVPVAGVGDDDDVGLEAVLVGVEQLDEGVGADLLLALDEHHQVDRQLVAEDPDRAEVGGDAGLVVGGAAAVEAVTRARWLPRRGVPVGVVVLRLDVVVGVEQDGRRALGAGLLGDHGRRRTVVRPDDLGLEALGREEVARRLGAALDLAGAGGVGGHRLDADQVLEVAADAGHDLGETSGDVDSHADTLGRGPQASSDAHSPLRFSIISWRSTSANPRRR